MKLTVPAIRAAEPDAHRKAVSEHTGELLATIDSLLSELSTPQPAGPRSGGLKIGQRVGLTRQVG